MTLVCCNCSNPAVTRGLCLWCARLFECDGGMTDAEAEQLLRKRPAPPSTAPQEAWRPIETAPERRKVLVTWINALGKRRTALASYWPEGTLDMADDVPDWQVNEAGQNLDAGWWEESEGNDDAMFRLIEKIDFWMPLPAAPLARPPQEGEK